MGHLGIFQTHDNFLPLINQNSTMNETTPGKSNIKLEDLLVLSTAET
jgi:hypothetical protein